MTKRSSMSPIHFAAAAMYLTLLRKFNEKVFHDRAVVFRPGFLLLQLYEKFLYRDPLVTFPEDELSHDLFRIILANLSSRLERFHATFSFNMWMFWI
jgi:hypothetical protein